MKGLLRRWFAGIPPHRRSARHFGRRALGDALATHGPHAAAPAELAAGLIGIARGTPADALKLLKSRSHGLTVAEATARLRRDGANVVAHEKPPGGWLRLWHAYENPFNLLLTVLAAVSLASADARSTVVIGFMVCLSTIIRMVQEGRSDRAAEALKAMVRNTASVLRSATVAAASAPPPAPVQLALARLVKGDVVVLSAGDMIPADCRLLTARDLFIAQAAMTGESLPVEKFAEGRDSGSNPLEQPTLVFMGTNVVSGSATALVVATGNQTYFGAVATSITATDRAPTAFQKGVDSVSWLLIRFALVMVPIVFVVNGMARGDWLEAGLFALSVAVGLTPEMLPMIVTTTLARGAVALSAKKVVVKRLDAIQNFGAMDVLCTDKTGTLTQDRIALSRTDDAFGNPSDEVLKFAWLNSHYQTGLKNMLDHAVLEHAELHAELVAGSGYDKIDEVPFDFVRRRMSVVVAAADGSHLLVCKGALDEMLSACTRVRVAPAGAAADLPLDAANLARVRQATLRMSQEGLRVVAVAIRTMPAGQSTYSVADEAGLTLVGYIAFLDPPKETAAPAIAALAGHGIAVKVLSGDNELVTAHVCAQVGLAGKTVLTGPEVEAMNDAELGHAVEAHQLFARLTPLQKERIVRALRANGHVVGFMGDGINDAPALRAADIGISVDTAVDIAREAADVILLEKSLLVVDAGVIEGRRTFSNMRKYIRMTASSNFGNVFSVLVACAFLPFLPMLPLQLLVQNLLYDFSQTGIPFDNVDAELVEKPLAWDPAELGRFMLFFGPISSMFDIATFALMWRVFGADSLATQGLFQSGWFVVGLLTQVMVVHLLRTPKLPVIESRAATPLVVMTLCAAAAGLFLPMGPLAAYFRFVPLPPAYFAWLAVILFGYALACTLMKRFYFRRYGW